MRDAEENKIEKLFEFIVEFVFSQNLNPYEYYITDIRNASLYSTEMIT